MRWLVLGATLLLTTPGCGDDAVGPCGSALCPGDAGGSDGAVADGSTDAPMMDGALDLDAGGGEDASPDTGCPEPCGSASVVISADELAGVLSDPTVQAVDTRGAAAWEAGRVPGAVLVDPGALRATVDGVGGQVAPPDVGQAALRAAGVHDDGTLVVYGAGTDTTSARVVWTLLYYGHPDVRLLDGGFGAWDDGSRPVDMGMATVPPSTFTVSPVDMLRVDADWVLAHLDDPTVTLVDARSDGEYSAGHIPGALSVDWQQTVTGSAFKPMTDVESLFAAADPATTVAVYCQTGSRASVDFVALQWLGYSDVRLYDGSWAEWGSRPDLPKEP